MVPQRTSLVWAGLGFLVGCSDPTQSPLEPAAPPLSAHVQALATLVASEHKLTPSDGAAGDRFGGQSYQRCPISTLEATFHDHEVSAFAERIGDRWAGSMGTKEWTQIALTDEIRADLPPFLKPVFPYRLFLGHYVTEWHVAAVLHESFHAFQATVSPARFAAAGHSWKDQDRYWAADPPGRDAWRREIAALRQAVEATSDTAAARFARAFLAHRSARRDAHRLDSALVAYETRNEWLEGLAKYVELEAWRAPTADPSYVPRPELREDPDFRSYATFAQRWAQELDQMERQADRQGDTRFYYTGMAQAHVLDRLRPNWKREAMLGDDALEALLAGTLAP